MELCVGKVLAPVQVGFCVNIYVLVNVRWVVEVYPARLIVECPLAGLPLTSTAWRPAGQLENVRSCKTYVLLKSLFLLHRHSQQ